MKFALIGLGFIAPRHLKAIEEVGGDIVCACDINENKFSIFELSKFKPKLYTDWTKMMESHEFKHVDYVSILTPNYLHFPQIIEARRYNKKVICEKPLVLKPEQLSVLLNDEAINTVLQLRHAYNIIGKSKYENEFNSVRMDILVHRGDWYFKSWKVNIDESGGLLWNIGVHYFDLLVRELGPFLEFTTSPMDEREMTGRLLSNTCKVDWKISLNANINEQSRIIHLNRVHHIDLTSITYGSKKVTTDDFSNLHTKTYKAILAGDGIKPKDLVNTTNLLDALTTEAIEFKKGVTG